jgi:CRISPR-associated protein Csa2
MFISFGFRFRTEAEALNMVESVGNYSRHRTAPMLLGPIKQGDKGLRYKITMAPAVSGQSIAFGYMTALVKLAIQRNLPVCDECKSYQELGGSLRELTM